MGLISRFYLLLIHTGHKDLLSNNDLILHLVAQMTIVLLTYATKHLSFPSDAPLYTSALSWWRSLSALTTVWGKSPELGSPVAGKGETKHASPELKEYTYK